jgi:hypothetical protein
MSRVSLLSLADKVVERRDSRKMHAHLKHFELRALFSTFSHSIFGDEVFQDCPSKPTMYPSLLFDWEQEFPNAKHG